MQKRTAASILNATKPFVMVRALVGAGVTLIMIVAGIIGALICYAAVEAENFVMAWIVAIVIFCGVIGFLRFVKRYVLYMIKAAHVAAITEYIRTGTAPTIENGYKGVVAYGLEVIKNNFVDANVAFGADALIAGATRQIMKWVNRIGNLFSWIPGADKVMAFVEFVLSTALNYIDEAVLSYVFMKKNEEGNGFKKACDGLVYYAQSWKAMLKGALKVGAFVWVVRIISGLLAFIIFTALGKIFFLASIILAFAILYGIEAILVTPYATCLMINDYHKAIEGQPIKADLHGTLCKVSSKFKSLFGKSNQPEPQVVAAEASPF